MLQQHLAFWKVAQGTNFQLVVQISTFEPPSAKWSDWQVAQNG
jgi:hypothetical protein